MPYFRHLARSADPRLLLDPEQQFSTPWGAPEAGRCDKCHGDGPVAHECLSCLEEGARADCPACEGRVRWIAVCPACAGTGQVVGLTRRGVSVFPGLGGLYRYLVERDFDFSDAVIVELEGEVAESPDLDAEAGAMLIHPTAVVTRHAVDEERAEDVRRRLQSVAAPR